MDYVRVWYKNGTYQYYPNDYAYKVDYCGKKETLWFNEELFPMGSFGKKQIIRSKRVKELPKGKKVYQVYNKGE